MDNNNNNNNILNSKGGIVERFKERFVMVLYLHTDTIGVPSLLNTFGGTSPEVLGTPTHMSQYGCLQNIFKITDGLQYFITFEEGFN